VSETFIAAPSSPPSAWRMYRAMVGIGLVCGLLIVVVFEVTRPVIERKRIEALERAVFHVLPDAASSRTFRLDGDGRFRALVGRAEGATVVHAGYDAGGSLVGVAVAAEGMGYQDVIRVLYGYSIAQEAIIGIRVLESKETPGLGDRIETDPAFLANFTRLDVSLDAAGSGIANPIEPVKHGKKEQPWQVDGITGATISSVAIANILRASSEAWVPAIRRNAADFEQVD
jgi:electron transport complex protein RnfG